MPQTPQIYNLRAFAHSLLLQQGPMTLNDLEHLTGIPKERFYYAIESTSPFGALFRKYVGRETHYEAVPIEDIYGEDDFY